MGTRLGRRLVLQDFLDAIHDLRSQLRDDLECFEVVGDLLRTRGSEDDGARVWLFRYPGEGEVYDFTV